MLKEFMLMCDNYLTLRMLWKRATGFFLNKFSFLCFGLQLIDLGNNKRIAMASTISDIPIKLEINETWKNKHIIELYK